jgi:hypothetical protein
LVKLRPRCLGGTGGGREDRGDDPDEHRHDDHYDKKFDQREPGIGASVAADPLA